MKPENNKEPPVPGCHFPGSMFNFGRVKPSPKKIAVFVSMPFTSTPGSLLMALRMIAREAMKKGKTTEVSWRGKYVWVLMFGISNIKKPRFGSECCLNMCFFLNQTFHHVPLQVSCESNTTINWQCSAFLHDMSPVSSTDHTRRAPTSSIK